MYVFVYGTLRKGYGNHRLLDGKADLIGVGTIKGRMFCSYLAPVVTEPEAESDAVTGELYLLHPTDAEATIKRLDALEGIYGGNASGCYVRSTVTATVDGKEYQAEVYLSRSKEHDKYLVPNGDWTTTKAAQRFVR